MRKTFATERKIKIPEFEIENVEDAYTYYVLILGIPEDIFWYSDISFLHNVVENKTAYDGWLNYTRKKQQDKERAKTRARKKR